jgi:transcriptional regulator with XRE-family HTH domain
MNHLNERINYLIKSLGMKKTAFAEKLNVSQAFVSQLCSGVKQPSERTIQDICTKFNVNEEWLRTGKGEIFIRLSRNDEISKFVGELMKEEEDSFKNRLIAGLAALDDTGWDVLETFLNSIQPKEKD